MDGNLIKKHIGKYKKKVTKLEDYELVVDEKYEVDEISKTSQSI